MRISQVRFQVYTFELDHLFMHEGKLDIFKSMGRRIRGTTIIDCVDSISLTCISKIIKNVRMESVYIEAKTHRISDEIA